MQYFVFRSAHIARMQRHDKYEKILRSEMHGLFAFLFVEVISPYFLFGLFIVNMRSSDPTPRKKTSQFCKVSINLLSVLI